MAKMTREEAARAVEEMTDAGINEGEIDGFLRDNGFLPQLLMDKPIGEQGLRGTQAAANIILPAVGGIYGSALTAGKGALAQFLGEAGGVAAGDVTGRAISGQSQNPVESLITGGVGGGIGTLYRTTTRALGSFGRVPDVFVQEAGVPTTQPRIPFTDAKIPLGSDVARVPGTRIRVPAGIPLPAVGKVTRALPRTASQVERGISAEETLADRARAASQKLSNKLTPERAAKEALIDQASTSGVLIPVAPIQDALRAKFISNPGPVTAEARVFNRRLQGTVDSLGQAASASGGTMSPTQIDRLIRQQLRPKVYTASGQPAHTLYAEAIGEAERASTKLLNDALPGDVRKMNEAISERLDAAEKAAKLFGEDRPGVINRLRNMHKPGNEDTLKSLRVLASETNDPGLAKDAMRLATKRAFSGDIREPSTAGEGGFFGLEARTPMRAMARTMAPFQAYVGPVAAPFATPPIMEQIMGTSQ